MHLDGCFIRRISKHVSLNKKGTAGTGVRQSRAPVARVTKFCIVALNISLASDLLTGVENFEVAPRFLENLCTLHQKHAGKSLFRK